jgi:hypothetical protein
MIPFSAAQPRDDTRTVMAGPVPAIPMLKGAAPR